MKWGKNKKQPAKSQNYLCGSFLVLSTGIVDSDEGRIGHSESCLVILHSQKLLKFAPVEVPLCPSLPGDTILRQLTSSLWLRQVVEVLFLNVITLFPFCWCLK